MVPPVELLRKIRSSKNHAYRGANVQRPMACLYMIRMTVTSHKLILVSMMMNNFLEKNVTLESLGYVRLTLVFMSCFFYSTNAVAFICLYLAQAILDGFDGALARKLKQTSAFGAWFDVVIDILGRGYLWCRLYKWGYFLAAQEWLVFVCTHTQLGAQWKSTNVSQPWIVQKVMEKNFKTPLGTFTILGLFLLPLWLYAHYTGVLGKTLRVPLAVQYAGITFFSVGRALSFSVEVFFIYSHIMFLTKDEQK